jgi:anti-sigma B factor antagonist
MTRRLRIDESRTGDITILRLKGRLEIEEGGELLRERVHQLVRSGRVKFVLDLAEVTRIDSMGLGILASTLLTTRQHGGAIKLLHTTENSAQLLDITRLSSVFEAFDDEGEAIRSFGAPAPPDSTGVVPRLV